MKNSAPKRVCPAGRSNKKTYPFIIRIGFIICVFLIGGQAILTTRGPFNFASHRFRWFAFIIKYQPKYKTSSCQKAKLFMQGYSYPYLLINQLLTNCTENR